MCGYPGQAPEMENNKIPPLPARDLPWTSRMDERAPRPGRSDAVGGRGCPGVCGGHREACPNEDGRSQGKVAGPPLQAEDPPV